MDSTCNSSSPYHPVPIPQLDSKVLEYAHNELLPKSGVLGADRALLKEATAAHAAFRAHSGDGDIAWQARMQKSGILVFELLEAGAEVENFLFFFDFL